jgi:hypothetical protein
MNVDAFGVVYAHLRAVSTPEVAAVPNPHSFPNPSHQTEQ